MWEHLDSVGAMRGIRRFAGLVAATLITCAVVAGCGGSSSSPSNSPTQPPSTPPTTTQLAQERWESMDLEEQAASLLMLYYPGTDAGATAEFVREIQPGGLVLMGDNIPADEATLADSIESWNAEAAHPLLIGIDEEGGTVTRLPSDTFPAAPQLRDGAPANTRAAFTDRGQLLHALGITVNFGVIADVTDDPGSFIWPRVLGSTPEAASENVAAAVEGEGGSVSSTLKHFPGHGLAAGDSHISIPTSDIALDEWRESAAPPFAAGIDAGAEFVMIGHLRFPEVSDQPASLSPEWHKILRDELGFDGIIITDSMSMLLDSGEPQYADPVQNAVDSLAAGSTMVLMVAPGTTENAHALVDGIASAVQSGEIDQDTFDSAGILLMEQRLELE